ncbi:MAG: family 20 glycosylhydrolase [Victivallaceae bacterium]|nr:family 20 glycosylhydrolase [Victivallaceae bacterium]
MSNMIDFLLPPGRGSAPSYSLAWSGAPNTIMYLCGVAPRSPLFAGLKRTALLAGFRLRAAAASDDRLGFYTGEPEPLPPVPVRGSTLVVTPLGVKASAADGEALLYALVRLNEAVRLSCGGTFCDAPEGAASRGIMLDLARVPETPSYVITQILPALAANRQNRLYLYFENKLILPGVPAGEPHPCAWTAADARRVVRAAREYAVEVVPVIASAGHREALLSQPRFAALAAPGTMDHLNPRSRRAVKYFERELAAYCRIFPSPVIHLAGDETPYLGDDNAQCYADFFNHAVSVAAAHGRRVMLWGDMLEHHPELLEKLDRRIEPVLWKYGAMDDEIKKTVVRWQNAGFTVAGAGALLADEPFFPSPERIRDNLARLPAAAQWQDLMACAWEPRTQFLDGAKIALAVWGRASYAPRPPWRGDPLTIASHALYGDAGAEEFYPRICGSGFFDLMVSSQMRYYHAFEFSSINPVRRRDPAIIAALGSLADQIAGGLSAVKPSSRFSRRFPADAALFRAQGEMALLLAKIPLWGERILDGGEPLSRRESAFFGRVLRTYRSLWCLRRRPDDPNFNTWFAEPLAFMRQCLKQGARPEEMLVLHGSKGEAPGWNLLRLRLTTQKRILFFKTLPLWMTGGLDLPIVPVRRLPRRFSVRIEYATWRDPARQWRDLLDWHIAELNADGTPCGNPFPAEERYLIVYDAATRTFEFSRRLHK